MASGEIATSRKAQGRPERMGDSEQLDTLRNISQKVLRYYEYSDVIAKKGVVERRVAPITRGFAYDFLPPCDRSTLPADIARLLSAFYGRSYHIALTPLSFLDEDSNKNNILGPVNTHLPEPLLASDEGIKGELPATAHILTEYDWATVAISPGHIELLPLPHEFGPHQATILESPDANLIAVAAVHKHS